MLLQMKDLQIKAQSISKLGQAVTAYGTYIGVCLRQLNEETFRLSLSDGAGCNWVAEVPIAEIEVGGQFRRKVPTNEYTEIEDESCEGGACKI